MTDTINDIIAITELPTPAAMQEHGLVPASATSLGTMETCPLMFDGKYTGHTVQKVVSKQNEGSIYGDQAHKAIEQHLLHDTPIADKFYEDLPKLAETLAWYKKQGFSKDGVEQVLSLNQDGACTWRERVIGVKSDLIINSGSGTKWYIDWKTTSKTNWKGEYKAPKLDKVQLELTAIIMFARDPELKLLVCAIEFLRHGQRFLATFRRDRATYELKSHTGKVTTEKFNVPMQLSHYWMVQRTKNFKPKPSGLCGWCDVVECDNWKPQPIRSK